MTEPLFLLDANICIYLLGGLSANARDRIEAREPGSVVTSAIVYAEVMRGIDADDVKARRATDAFFSVCTVLPFDADAALAYRTIPFRRGAFDRLIAAHALSLGVVLVTSNLADFADIPGLNVEYWTQ